MIKNTEKNKRVLIAEDSLTQAEKLIFSLQNLGMEVHHALNGKLACELIEEVNPVMIISDVMMPEMDGYGFVKYVRSNKKWDHIPFILLTTLSDLNDVLHGLECGADSYVMKPFNEHYLHSRLNQVMENKELLASREQQDMIDFEHLGKKYHISSTAPQILNLLFSSYESAIYRNIEMEERENELMNLNRQLRKEIEQRKRDLIVELEQISQAESNLKSSEAKFRGLVDNAHVGIYLMTLEGEITLSNEAFRNMLSFDSEEQLMNTSFHELFEDPEEMMLLIEKLKKENSFKEHETILRTRRNGRISVLMNANLIGNLVSGMVLDISDKKDAEVQMKKTREKLIKSKDKAETSETLKNSFIANMSNEILNPLNSLVGFTKLLQTEGLTNENLLEYTDQVNLSGNNLINIVENIIDIAKVESGELLIKKGPCKINKMLLDLYSEIQQNLIDLKKSNLSIVVKRENKDPDFTIFTEPYRLKRIFTNLLSNAIKYTEKGNVVFGYELTTNESEGLSAKIRFFVKDTGKGMPEDKQKSLFDRFNQEVVSYKKLADGAGLGLPLAKAYVELLGGKIWCESVLEEGTTFYFTLPMQYGENCPSELTEESRPRFSSKNENLKILIAEDNTSNYYLLEALLDDANVILIWAKNGKEAVECMQKNKDIDLILMDLQMPVMSGQEAVKEIRLIDKSIPIIALTAFAREENRAEILSLGCTSFLPKPIMRDALLKEVENIFY